MDAQKAGTLEEVFGTGTAATIAHVSDIGYQSQNFELNAIENRTISNMLKDELEGIKTSTKDDPFGWVMKLHSREVV